MTPAILICTPQEDTADTLKAILAYTFPLIVVTDEEQCLATLEQKALPALALVDISSDETGNLFGELRQRSAKLTIIAVGESGAEDNAVMAVNRGADGYIMPPLRKDDVLALAQKYTSPTAARSKV